MRSLPFLRSLITKIPRKKKSLHVLTSSDAGTHGPELHCRKARALPAPAGTYMLAHSSSDTSRKGEIPMPNRQRVSVLAMVRDSVIVSLSFALATLFLLALGAHAQTAPSTSAPGWVVIPVEEYQHLRARAFPGEREPEPPPVEATLTRVDYDLHVNSLGDLAT